MLRPIIFDAHVHFYPEYNAALAIANARKNLSKSGHASLGGSLPIHALCLTERADCHFFKSLKESKTFPGMSELKIVEVNGALRLKFPEGSDLFIIPGRQIVSSEKLEILAFGSDLEIPDRKFSCGQIFDLIKEAAGLPVVNWAPGKWWFKRGLIVKQILASFPSDEYLLCDTTLRPVGYLEPFLMRQAKSRGVKILRGSDPLPVKGEEAMLGRYITRAEAEFDESDPIGSFKRILMNPSIKLEAAGDRSNFLQLALRIFKFYSSK